MDIWVPSSPNIDPQVADQYAVGYFRNFWVNFPGTPCKGLPLRREALPLLQNRWGDLLPVAVDSDRILLHYLDGKIDVELCLPLAYYAGSGESAELRRALKEAIRDLPQFGDVRLLFA